MAIDIYELYRLSHTLREDLVIIFVAHIKGVTTDDYGTKWITKTNGKKLTDINLNSKLNYNLYSRIEREGDKQAQYYYVTQSDGNTEARSTFGVLDYKIPNDLYQVVKAIREKDLGLTDKY